MNEKSIRLFDTHCHLDFFDEKVTEEISSAQAHGVDRFLIPGCGAFNWERIEQISNTNRGVYFSLGLHPYFLDKYDEAHLELLDRKLSSKNEKCVAVGECGLDFYSSREQEEQQKQLFTEQIKLANRYQLPLILHSRKAHQETISILKQQKFAYGGVIHGFTGSLQQAMDYVKLGFYIGVGGTITYPRAKKTRETISRLPLDVLVLETDSPDMPIFGRQGQKNRPSNVIFVLNELNVLRSESVQTIAVQIFKNSKAMYSICE